MNSNTNDRSVYLACKKARDRQATVSLRRGFPSQYMINSFKNPRTGTNNNIVVHKNLTNVTAVSTRQIFVLKEQQNNGWSDITLFGKNPTGSHGIKGHKMVLSAASGYLQEAFTSNDFTDSGGKEYHVTQIEHEILEVIVNFIYTNTLQVEGNSGMDRRDVIDRLKSMLIGADYLLMPGLREVCGESLKDPAFLEMDSAVSMWLFGRKYHCEVLEDAALREIFIDIGAVSTRIDFLNLDEKNIVELLKVLVSKKAVAGLVCEAAIAWLGYKQAERKKNCDEIMLEVCLSEVSVEVLQRASEAKFLSKPVLWAVREVRNVKNLSENAAAAHHNAAMTAAAAALQFGHHHHQNQHVSQYHHQQHRNMYNAAHYNTNAAASAAYGYPSGSATTLPSIYGSTNSQQQQNYQMSAALNANQSFDVATVPSACSSSSPPQTSSSAANAISAACSSFEYEPPPPVAAAIKLRATGGGGTMLSTTTAANIYGAANGHQNAVAAAAAAAANRITHSTAYASLAQQNQSSTVGTQQRLGARETATQRSWNTKKPKYDICQSRQAEYDTPNTPSPIHGFY